MNALFKKEMPILVEGLKLVHKKFKDRFDMSRWSSSNNGTPSRSPKCHTSGCAMGWKNSFIKDSPIKCRRIKVKWASTSYYQLRVRYKGLEEFEAISAAYGITRSQANYLFDNADYCGKPTALEVAHRIESVLYNGFPVSIADGIGK